MGWGEVCGVGLWGVRLAVIHEDLWMLCSFFKCLRGLLLVHCPLLLFSALIPPTLPLRI